MEIKIDENLKKLVEYKKRVKFLSCVKDYVTDRIKKALDSACLRGSSTGNKTNMLLEKIDKTSIVSEVSLFDLLKEVEALKRYVDGLAQAFNRPMFEPNNNARKELCDLLFFLLETSMLYSANAQGVESIKKGDVITFYEVSLLSYNNYVNDLGDKLNFSESADLFLDFLIENKFDIRYVPCSILQGVIGNLSRDYNYDKMPREFVGGLVDFVLNENVLANATSESFIANFLRMVRLIEVEFDKKQKIVDQLLATKNDYAQIRCCTDFSGFCYRLLDCVSDKARVVYIDYHNFYTNINSDKFSEDYKTILKKLSLMIDNYNSFSLSRVKEISKKDAKNEWPSLFSEYDSLVELKLARESNLCALLPVAVFKIYQHWLSSSDPVVIANSLMDLYSSGQMALVAMPGYSNNIDRDFESQIRTLFGEGTVGRNK